LSGANGSMRFWGMTIPAFRCDYGPLFVAELLHE
jgi:hypothetical protein